MVKQSHYEVIEDKIQHLGHKSNWGRGTFVGPHYTVTFTLPDNTNPQELAVIQCRTLHIHKPDKMFLLNSKKIYNILEPHPNNPDDWIMDIAVVPQGVLQPGKNSIHISYVDVKAKYLDDFFVDNIVLWYKTENL